MVPSLSHVPQPDPPLFFTFDASTLFTFDAVGGPTLDLGVAPRPGWIAFPS